MSLDRSIGWGSSRLQPPHPPEVLRLVLLVSVLPQTVNVSK